jgi:hypothetical protein
MAAIQALVDEKHGIRAGNPNPTYYKIAKSEFGSAGNSACYSINQTSAASTCVFYDRLLSTLGHSRHIGHASD